MSRGALRLAAVLFLWSTGYNLNLPFLPLMAAEFGATPGQVGLLQALAYSGAALALFPAGWLADRYGRRRAVLAVWFVGGLGAFVMLPAASWQGLLPGAFLMLCGAAGVPLLAALAAETVPPSAMRRSMNAVFAAAPMGLLAGSALAGYVADAWGLQVLHVASGACTLVAVACLWAGRSASTADGEGRAPSPEGAGPSSRSAAPGEALGAGFAGPPGARILPLAAQLLLLGIPAGAVFMLLNLPGGFMTPYLRDIVGLSLTGTGITNAQLAVGQLAWSALFSFWPGEGQRREFRLGDHFRLRYGAGTLLAMTVCMAANAVFGLLFLMGNLSAIIAALLLRGAFFSLQPLGMALLTETTGTTTGLAGRFSFMALLMGAAAAVSPALSGYMYARIPTMPFVVTGLTAGLGTLALLLVRLMSIRIPGHGGGRA